MKFKIVATAAAALALAACGGAPDAGNNPNSSSTSDGYTLTGPVQADAKSEASGGGCIWKPSVFDLSYNSGKLQNGAQVNFEVTVGIGAIGDESATTPPVNGHTPLTLTAGGKTIQASDGMVHVTDADLGARHWKGTIEATFADGTKISGPWSCTAPLGS